MFILKYNLKEIVKCKHCGRYEYWGKMSYIGNKTYCRQCYAELNHLDMYEYSDDEQEELERR